MGAKENEKRGDILVASASADARHSFPQKNFLPNLEVSEPEPEEKQPTEQQSQPFRPKAKLDCDGGVGFGPLWKLDRRDSGSLFWRRDSIANSTSKVRFRYDVDVMEFQPHPHEHERLPHEKYDSSDAEDDLYDDDFCLEDESGWFLKRTQLLGARSASKALASTKESSVVMSLVCVAAILLTAYVQLVVV